MKEISKEKFYEYLNKAKSVLELFHLIGYKSNSGVPYRTINKYNNLFKCNIEEYIKKNNEIKKENKNKFIVPHVCKNCGKEFKEKYSKWSNGNFCCKKCAMSYSSNIKREEVNKKISITIINKSKKEYDENPKICPICGNIIPYEKRKRKTCSEECSHKLCSKIHKEKGIYNIGGYVLFSCRSHHGYYKGIYCDSTFELAYLIYCLDHNIDIKRCNETFEYEYEGKKHKYHPDFVVKGVITEIKNYNSKLVDVKAESVDKPYKILYREDLQEVFEYVAKTYNKKYNKHSNNFYELYDNFTDR